MPLNRCWTKLKRKLATSEKFMNRSDPTYSVKIYMGKSSMIGKLQQQRWWQSIPEIMHGVMLFIPMDSMRCWRCSRNRQWKEALRQAMSFILRAWIGLISLSPRETPSWARMRWYEYWEIWHILDPEIIIGRSKQERRPATSLRARCKMISFPLDTKN